MRRRPVIIVASLVVAVLVAGIGVWWFLLRSDAPPAVNLDDAVASVTTTTTGPATTTTTITTSTVATGGEPTSTTAPVTTTTTITATGAQQLDGTWQVDDSGTSFVGYRVEEELANFGFTEAVGRTTLVSGSLELSDLSITSVAVEADMTALRSDSSRRDGALRSQALETNRFPTADFELTEPIALDGEPAPGEALEFTATGDLTIHGVTRPVAIPLQAQLVEDVIVVVGSLPVIFSDYDIDPPSAAIVLSVEDNGVMEFQLVFRRASP